MAGRGSWRRRRRTRRVALGVGIPAGVIVALIVAASLVLTAPGVAVAGAPVGLVTQGIAEQNITDRLAHAEIRVGDAVLTGAELGASVDAHALARHAIADHPLWNVTAWNPAPRPAAVTIDPAVAVPALRAAAPELFTDAVNARVVFDTKAAKFTAIPSRPGVGVDLDDLAARLGTALTTGARAVSVTPTQTTAEAPATTRDAEAFAAKLNAEAATAGFYVGDQLVEPVSLTSIGAWVSVAADAQTGKFAITPDRPAIDTAVAGLAAKVDRDPENETVVTNSAGKRLRVVREGRAGVHLTETDVPGAVAASLTRGELRFTVRGDLTPFETTTVFRRIEVDKSAGETYLYEGPAAGREKLVASYPVAIGTGGVHETRSGHFAVYAQLPTQNMGDCDGDHGFGYCTKNVPWVSYFDGDQGFHGTYWHNNFGPGARMSHGCVNMRIADALAVYRFAQVGTEVWVHD